MEYFSNLFFKSLKNIKISVIARKQWNFSHKQKRIVKNPVVVVFMMQSPIFTFYSTTATTANTAKPSPQSSTAAHPIRRERVFICQERINIPRKFISLNRQWAENFSLSFAAMTLSRTLQIMNVLSLFHHCWLPQTFYFRFMNPIHNVCDFSVGASERGRERVKAKNGRRQRGRELVSGWRPLWYERVYIFIHTTVIIPCIMCNSEKRA